MDKSENEAQKIINSLHHRVVFYSDLKITGFGKFPKDCNCNFEEEEKMKKADIVINISEKLGMEKEDVQAVIESFMNEIKTSLENGDNVYLRGFGSFIVKTRAEKTGRNISKNTTIIIPAHNIPVFKPAKIFLESVKNRLLTN